MKIVYIASKFTEEDMRFRWIKTLTVRVLIWLCALINKEFANVLLSSKEVHKQMKKGNSPISPLSNNVSWWKWGEHFYWAKYLNADFALIKKCDEIVFLPNWKESDGAIKEFRFATSLRIPVERRRE